MVELRTDRIRRNARKNVSGIDPIPSGPDDGFYCEEYTIGVLRMIPQNALASCELEIWSFEYDGGNDWAEDPPERRAIALGRYYTRAFRVGPIDRMKCRITAITGKFDIFWTYS